MRFRQVPPIVGVAAIVAVAFLALPVIALLVRTPWASPEILFGPQVREALGLSVVTATISAAVAVAIGVPYAWVLARTQIRGRSLLRALATVPIVLPPVVGGVALLLAFGRSGLLGPALQSIGLALPFTSAAVVLAQTFVALPFVVLTVEAGLRSLAPGYEEAAATLGANPSHTFARVTIPLIAPSIGAAALLAWSRALGEFGATIAFAGNLPGVTRTVPLAVFVALQSDPQVAFGLGTVLLFVSLVVIVGLRGRWIPRR